MSMEDYDFLFKIVLIGNAGVGKTCLVRRFTQGLFPPGQGATIGVDFMIKTVEINGEKVKLQIWDTAGQERFRSITQSYYRSANALILTYDITCEESFRCLPEWLREIEQYASNKVITVLATRSIWLKGERSPNRELKNSQKLRTCITWRPQPRNLIMWRNSSLTWPADSSVKPDRTHL
ncbi:ras-related protein Rab-30 isoform X2 [Carlito syrichta]|uniref:Ras-related protein Rab-30 isoform X2 n=1 Tax=Carlito syrichta TaxID=1868482 RepID=A0A3Q0ECG5_CARSF|nr:ras-related protein Rab-30 isoform X2 [Carlito syrichta]